MAVCSNLAYSALAGSCLMAEPARANWYVTASESVLPDIIWLLGLPKVMIENRVEPAKTEPATAETATVEPATAEPAKVEPAKGEPVKAEPAKVKPAKAEPARPLEGLESLLLASHSFHAVLLKWQREHLTHLAVQVVAARYRQHSLRGRHRFSKQI